MLLYMVKPGEKGESHNSENPPKFGARSYSVVALATDISQGNKNYRDSGLHITMHFKMRRQRCKFIIHRVETAGSD
jgi:hypothetical protein